MSTRAIQFLEQKKIPFKVVRYGHGEKGARFAAHATGFALEATVKTLVVGLAEKNYTLVLKHRQCQGITTSEPRTLNLEPIILGIRLLFHINQLQQTAGKITNVTK